MAVAATAPAPAAALGSAEGYAAASLAQVGKLLPREKQVAYVRTLLERKGEDAAKEIRRRISKGQGVTVKGLEFDALILTEALSTWSEGRPSAAAAAPAPGGASSARAPAAPTPTRGVTPAADGGGGSSSSRRPDAGAAAAGAGRGRGAEAAAAGAPPDGRGTLLAHRRLSRKTSASSEEQARSLARAPAGARRPGEGPAPAEPPAVGGERLRLPRTSVGGAGRASASPFTTAKEKLLGVAPSGLPTARRPSAPAPAPASGSWTLRLSPDKRKGAPSSEDPEPRESPRKARRQAAGGRAPAAEAPAAAARAPASVEARAPTAPALPAQPMSEQALQSLSVKELKAFLSEQQIDFAGAVEKAELQALWSRFALLRSRSLAELQASCLAQGGPRLGSVEACARYLASPTPAAPKADAGAPASAPASATAIAPAAPPRAEDPSELEKRQQAARREAEAQTEVLRILRLRREGYVNAAGWGFAVLCPERRDVPSVQRSYRNLMKRLHPDKVGQSESVSKATQLVKEAKEVCERSLSSVEAPPAPRGLRSECLVGTRGKRKFRLTWTAPAADDRYPVRRYVVAAVDPAYGRALTVTTLEPDYNQELRRFVSLDELTSYVFSEEELQKMPRLWEQERAMVQVAASNEAGQSPWSILQVPLSGAAQSAAAVAAAAVAALRRAPARVGLRRPGYA